MSSEQSTDAIQCADCGNPVDVEVKIGRQENAELILTCDECGRTGRITDKEYLGVLE